MLSWTFPFFSETHVYLASRIFFLAKQVYTCASVKYIIICEVFLISNSYPQLITNSFSETDLSKTHCMSFPRWKKDLLCKSLCLTLESILYFRWCTEWHLCHNKRWRVHKGTSQDSRQKCGSDNGGVQQ